MLLQANQRHGSDQPRHNQLFLAVAAAAATSHRQKQQPAAANRQGMQPLAAIQHLAANGIHLYPQHPTAL